MMFIPEDFGYKYLTKETCILGCGVSYLIVESRFLIKASLLGYETSAFLQASLATSLSNFYRFIVSLVNTNAIKLLLLRVLPVGETRVRHNSPHYYLS
jgi:hypothetical protein